jgi:Flp pilus assembly pilin Flp
MALALLQLRSWLAAVYPGRGDDRGTTVVEYALLVALLAIVCLVGVNLIGEPVSTGLSAGGDGFHP